MKALAVFVAASALVGLTALPRVALADGAPGFFDAWPSDGSSGGAMPGDSGPRGGSGGVTSGGSGGATPGGGSGGTAAGGSAAGGTAGNGNTGGAASKPASNSSSSCSCTLVGHEGDGAVAGAMLLLGLAAIAFGRRRK